MIAPTQKMVIGLVLAGGHGKRLGGITDPVRNVAARPKPLVQVATGLAMDYSLLAFEKLQLKDVYVSTTSSFVSQIQQHIYNRLTESIPSIKMWIENTQRGTARAIDFFLRGILKKMGSSGENITLIVQACDTPHNLDILPMLENHHEGEADLTVGVIHRPFYKLEKESTNRTFSNVVTEGFDFKCKTVIDSEYEEMLDGYYEKHIGSSRPISYFGEKAEGDIRDSTFISTHIYIINVEFWINVIRENLRRDFSDIGFHVFPAMASVSQPTHFSERQIWQYKKIRDAMRGRKFNGYFFPPTKGSERTFWCDVGTPYLLWTANMQGLEGRFGNLDGFSFGKSWIRTALGLVGSETAKKLKLKELKEEGNVQTTKNIIGNNCTIAKPAKINNSVIGEYTIIDKKVSLNNVLVLGGTPEKPTHISNAELTNCIVSGGSIFDKRFFKSTSADRAIIYVGTKDEVVIGKLIR